MMIFPASFINHLFLLTVVTDAANILGIALYDGNSHWLVMKSVFKSLEDAGHNITVITPYSAVKDTNFTVIDVSKILPLRTNSFNYDYLLKEYYNPLRTLHALPNLSLRQCEKGHASREIQEISKDGHNFDIVISEVFGTDCDSIFAHLLKVPLISVITSTLLPWANARVGNPENPSYISNIMLPYSDRMEFQQRTINVFYYLYSLISTWYYNRVTTNLNRKHFGSGIPSAEELHQKTSLVFVNSHLSVDVARPYVPNIVEIGGIHLKPINPLPKGIYIKHTKDPHSVFIPLIFRTQLSETPALTPLVAIVMGYFITFKKDISQFLDDSKYGVIYFSLGSVLRASSLPNKTIDAIRETFAELEYDIIWKFEDENLNVSSNVFIRRWFPQRDILAHKNIKLVIMHGGLMGIYETIDVGVPAIGMPLFFDQQRNIQNLVSKGAALRLEIDKITKNYLLTSIRRVIEDKRFKQRAQELSKRFHDRSIEPSKAVVYWTEYVINYNGAAHLKSGVMDLYWFQAINLYLLLFYVMIILIVVNLFRKIYSTLSNLKQKISKNGMLHNQVTKNDFLRNGIHVKVN